MIMPYILNVALVLGACVAFYKILLRRETFYRINRYVLISCLAIAFLLPLFEVPQEFSLRKPGANKAFATIIEPPVKLNPLHPSAASGNTEIKPVVHLITNPNNIPTSNSSILDPLSNAAGESSSSFSLNQLAHWAVLLYWFGVIVFSLSFIFQLTLLLWRSFRAPSIREGRFRIVLVKGNKAPCSFGNTIFINPNNYDAVTLQQILLHEKVHVRQRHTIDIILAEIVLIFQWFNPFAWIYRREIENNLEYLTDDQLVQHPSVNKQTYQLSLLKVSAPHMPLKLTANYNQSTLKKRIAMMNTKRSNLQSTWKYLFLIPVFALLACLLNKPVAQQTSPQKDKIKTEAEDQKQQSSSASVNSFRDRELSTKNIDDDPATEGYWFAIIKGNEINIRFSDEKIDNDRDTKGHTYGGSDFKLAELSNYSPSASGTFTIARDAGKMELKGRFDGNTGMGTYQFVADKEYVNYMNSQLSDRLDDENELLAFFMINIRRDYVSALKAEGYSKIGKEDLIPMAALEISAAYIRSLKNAGFRNISLEELVPFKALGITDDYIKEIRNAGYQDITPEKLISFKAQGIDKEYITKMKKIKGKSEDGDDEDILSYKALGIDEDFVHSFKSIGIDVPSDQLVAYKALGITPEYIKGWHNAGFKDIDPEDFVGMKSQNITVDYLKSFTELGYKNIKPEDLVAFRALGIDADYIRGWQTAGYKNIDLENFTALKSQNITPEFIKGFEALGFKNIDPEDMIAVKAMGITPSYIKEMRAKGLNYDSLEKYIRLKSID